MPLMFTHQSCASCILEQDYFSNAMSQMPCFANFPVQQINENRLLVSKSSFCTAPHTTVIKSNIYQKTSKGNPKKNSLHIADNYKCQANSSR